MFRSMPLRVRYLVFEVVLLTVGGLLTLAVMLKLENFNQQQLQQSLTQQAEDMADQVVNRINLYEYGLRGMRGVVLVAGDRLNELAIKSYAMTRNLDQEFPGARGFGFIRKVSEQALPGYLADQQKVREHFGIRQIQRHEGDRFIIEYIEPLLGNAEAVGLDIASESARRNAAIAAMTLGDVQLTAPITLVQTAGKRLQSFLILLPVYRIPVTPLQPEEREQQLLGWSYAPLLMGQVLADLKKNDALVSLRFTDITDNQHPEVFYSTLKESTSDSSQVVQATAVQRAVFGRQWQIEVIPQPGFAASLHLVSPVQVAVVGAVVNLLLAMLLYLLISGRMRRGEYLSQRQHLAAIVDGSVDGIVSTDADGIITSWNSGAERLLGFPAETMLGTSLTERIVPENLQQESERILTSVVKRGLHVRPLETRRLALDGQLIDVSVSASGIRDASGRLVGLSQTIRDISRQKQAQAHVLELQHKLEQQVEQRTGEADRINQLLQGVLRSSSEVGIVATTKEGVITLFNSGAERMLGYCSEEMVGIRTPVIFHDSDELKQRAQQLTEALGVSVDGFDVLVALPEREGAETREWTYMTRQGKRLTVSVSVTAICSENSNEVTGYLGIVFDITHRKRTEMKLQQSLKTTQAILDTAVNPIITMDRSGNIKLFNPAAEQLFGYSSGEIIGSSIRMLMPPSVDAVTDNFMHSLLIDIEAFAGSNRTFEQEIQAMRHDGSLFPAQISFGAVEQDGGLIVVGVLTDLSEHYQHQSVVQSAISQLEMAAEVAELGVWSWDTDTELLTWNDRMFSLYQQPVELKNEDLELERWSERVHPDDQVMAESLLRTCMDVGYFDTVFRIVWPDGNIRHIQCAARAERASHGRVIRITGINQDITEQILHEAHLRYARDQADASSAAKSAFLANMSHEIRTPMTAVLGMLALLQQSQLTERQSDYLSKAQNAGRSLLLLLNDVLDYSKIEAGKLALDVHPFDMNELLRTLGVVMAGNLGQKPVELVFDITPCLPVQFEGDSKRLLQVLINLAGNALKFTPSGHVMVRVSILADREQSMDLRIEVIDTGIGISDEQQQRIFSSFIQAEASVSRHFGGTGLGLVICKRLVELMGSELQLESRQDRGSRFWFDVKLQRTDNRSTYLASAENPTCRVLLVENKSLVATPLMRLGEAAHWDMVQALDGIAAVDYIAQANQREQPVHLVVLDASIVGIRVEELILRLRVAPLMGQAPAVIVLGVLDDHCQPLSEAAEGVAFLCKPVTPAELYHVANELLNGKQIDNQVSTDLANPRLAGVNLLVVEDNGINREIVSELLRLEGARVDLAESGQEGVNRVSDNARPYDLVLMDIQMPGMDGLEATRLIRTRVSKEQLPILAMTANVSLDDYAECIEAGMNGHVGKPIDLDRIVTAILATIDPARSPSRPVMANDQQSGGETDVLVEPLATILRRFGGKQEIYTRLLATIKEDFGVLLEKLALQLQSAGWPEAAATLHALKGNAGTMGAIGLAKRAAALEPVFVQAGSEGNNLPDSDSLIAELRHLSERSVVALQQAVQALDGMPEAKAMAGSLVSSQPGVYDRPLSSVTGEEDQEIANWLNSLDASLDNGDMKVVEMVECCPEVIRSAYPQWLEPLIMQIGSLEFEQARQTLRQMRGDQ